MAIYSGPEACVWHGVMQSARITMHISLSMMMWFYLKMFCNQSSTPINIHWLILIKVEFMSHLHLIRDPTLFHMEGKQSEKNSLESKIKKSFHQIFQSDVI